MRTKWDSSTWKHSPKKYWHQYRYLQNVLLHQPCHHHFHYHNSHHFFLTTSPSISNYHTSSTTLSPSPSLSLLFLHLLPSSPSFISSSISRHYHLSCIIHYHSQTILPPAPYAKTIHHLSLSLSLYQLPHLLIYTFYHYRLLLHHNVFLHYLLTSYLFPLLPLLPPTSP